MSNISNKPNEPSKNKSTKSIAEEMGLKRVQSSESEKSSVTPEPKVKRQKKGLEQISESEKQVSDRSIHFSDSSTAMDAYLSKIEMGKQRLGELVNEGGDMAGAIKGYLSEQDLLNLQSLNKTTAERRPSSDELRVVLTEEDLDVSNNNKLHEKLQFAKANGLKIAIRTSSRYFSQSQGGVIEDFVKFARNNESVLSDIELLEFQSCSVLDEDLCPVKDFENVLKQCTEIEKINCDCIPGDYKDLFTLKEMPKLTDVVLGDAGIAGHFRSIKFQNLPKLKSVYVNTLGSIAFENLPELSCCRVGIVQNCLRFIGKFPALKEFICHTVLNCLQSEIIFPQELNSLKKLFFGVIYRDCITFPRELNALEDITFGEIMTRDLMTLRLPNLPNLKKIEYSKDYTPENIVKTFEDLQSQIDARAEEKAKGENS